MVYKDVLSIETNADFNFFKSIGDNHLIVNILGLKQKQ